MSTTDLGFVGFFVFLTDFKKYSNEKSWGKIYLFQNCEEKKLKQILRSKFLLKKSENPIFTILKIF